MAGFRACPKLSAADLPLRRKRRSKAATSRWQTYCFRLSRMDGPVVCLDLDGVMNDFDGWKGADYFHPPRPGLVDFVRELRESGYLIVVHTVRWAPHVWAWIRKYGLESYISDVTNLKIPAHVYIDDRAICFRGNFSETLERVKSFRAHWEDSHKSDVD